MSYVFHKSLQVEAFDMDDNRLYAAGCILQVFKLKGADRKHKQDRDKIQKRPPSEQVANSVIMKGFNLSIKFLLKVLTKLCLP